CLLVADLDEPDLVLILAQGLEDAVDPVAGQAEDGIHAPGQQLLDDHVARRLGHRSPPLLRTLESPPATAGSPGASALPGPPLAARGRPHSDEEDPNDRRVAGGLPVGIPPPTDRPLRVTSAGDHRPECFKSRCGTPSLTGRHPFRSGISHSETVSLR